jgi:hypothetical protein
LIRGSEKVKNSIVAGLIAGIVAAIVGYIVGSILVLMGMTTASPLNSTIWYMVLLVIWGIVFAPVFAKAYNIIPGKGWKKGLNYGLLIWVLSTIYAASWLTLPLTAAGFIEATFYAIFGIFTRIAYGVALGALYKK